MNLEIDDVPNIEITVKAETLEDDLFKIYNQLFKNSVKNDLEILELQGGYVNSIYKIRPKKDKSKSLVFRTFGMKFNSEELSKSYTNFTEKQEKQEKQEEQEKETKETTNEPGEILKKDEIQKQNGLIESKAPEQAPDFSNMIFNRIAEYKVMNEVSKHGLCKKVYAKYTNGICYGYTDGVVLNGPLMLTEDFLNEMTFKLAKFHSIKYEIPGINFKTHFERIITQIGPAFQAMVIDADKKISEINEFPYNELPRAHVLFEAEEKIINLLNDLGFGRIVFCHNDCNQKNLIWNSQERTLGFIDFEMSMNNYAIFDLGYLFGCYPGHFLYDFDKSLFPNPDYRRRFIGKYLKEFYKLNDIKLTDNEFETELEDYFIKVNLTSLLHISRLATLGGFFDTNPAMFNNRDFLKARETDKYFCGKFSLKIYKLFVEIYEPFIEQAKEYLKNKKEVTKEASKEETKI